MNKKTLDKTNQILDTLLKDPEVSKSSWLFIMCIIFLAHLTMREQKKLLIATP